LFSDPLGLGGFGQTAHDREYAAFANFDYNIASNFDIAASGRYSENNQSFHELGSGFFGSAENIRTESSQGVFTWSGDARWHITPENMLYARIATGFVPGGPNDVVSTIHNLPLSYSSSTDVNYEAGLKSSLFHDHVTVEVSAFDVVWHDIQLETFIDQLGALTNGGGSIHREPSV
jgi:iron complex outermembrane receptor protein